MGKAKDIWLEPIQAKIANEFIKRTHYSGKVAQNSQVHMGVFYQSKLEGVLQFGPSLDKHKLIGLVEDTKWHEFAELNRLAFTDVLPRNSESRAISVAMRLLRQHAPQLKWVISFADATQCGDGTIYRATGFVLTGIKKSHNLCRLPSGRVIHKMTLESGSNGKTKYKRMPDCDDRSYWEITGGRYDFQTFSNETGGVILPGHQLRYIYFLDPSYRSRLTVPEIPYSQIWEMGAGMYKGEKVEQQRAGVV